MDVGSIGGALEAVRMVAIGKIHHLWIEPMHSNEKGTIEQETGVLDVLDAACTIGGVMQPASAFLGFGTTPACVECTMGTSTGAIGSVRDDTTAAPCAPSPATMKRNELIGTGEREERPRGDRGNRHVCG